ncbi:MAG: HTTM domain-containing protein [Planctomycetaceae bacterium]
MDIPTTKRNSSSVREFFYAEETPYGLAIIRIILPLILLCVVVPRWSHSRELFSADGAASPLADIYGLLNYPPEPGGALAVAMMSALAFCLVAASIGWHTRFALVASWILYTYLNMLDSLSTFTKYSVISSHVLFLLSLSSCGAIWSVDYWRTRHHEDSKPPKASAWPRRLIQLLIGLVYFGAAFTKMHTDGFMSGDQIRFWLLTNMNNPNPLGEHLAMYPEMIVAMSHIAVIWQIVFVFLSWRGRARLIILGMGTLFHLSTVWILGLYIFPPIMILTYFAWLNEHDMQRIRSWYQRLSGRSGFRPVHLIATTAQRLNWQIKALVPVPSAVILCIGLSATVLAGLELEHRIDPYRKRQAGGPLTLQPLDPDVAQEMLNSDVGIREADKFFAMELGTELLAGVVVDRGTSFEPGDHVIVQCALIPPHEDMWISCCLIDPDGVEIHRYGRPISRDMLRADFMFTFPQDLKPGDYQFVAHSGRQQVLSRTVQLAQRESAVFGN